MQGCFLINGGFETIIGYWRLSNLSVAKNPMIERTIKMFSGICTALPIWGFVPQVTACSNFLALLFSST